MAVTILLCYAPEDRRMVGEFKKHLTMLERNEHIVIWDRGNISPGVEWKQKMESYLNEAQMILLLISASFLASDYCYSEQMQKAIKRHERKEARVIPILFRSFDWQWPPLDKLQALPDENKAISKWRPQEEGFTNVVTGIVKVVKQWNEHNLPGPTAERNAFMADLNHLIETVIVQLQPPARARAIADTLQELSIFIPNDVTLADLVVGWRMLSRARQNEEEIAITRRRITCGELADLASQFTTEQGNVEQAIRTWRIWRDAFQKSDNRRQATMAATFGRELTELEEASHG